MARTRGDVAAVASTTATALGTLLRAWRGKRKVSQMALALEVGVSPRHLSFVETGRANASAALVMQLARQLGLGLRESNELLLAAGFAPRFPETDFESAALANVRGAMQRLVAAHDPYPGVVMNRHWNIVHANQAATRMLRLLPPSLATPSVNMLRASLHPEGFAAMTENFDAWGRHLVDAIEGMARTSLDPAVAALRDEVLAYPNVQRLMAQPQPSAAAPSRASAAGSDALLLPCVMRLGGQRLSLFSTKLALTTPLDVTLSELLIELFYPNDEATGAILRCEASARYLDVGLPR